MHVSIFLSISPPRIILLIEYFAKAKGFYCLSFHWIGIHEVFAYYMAQIWKFYSDNILPGISDVFYSDVFRADYHKYCANIPREYPRISRNISNIPDHIPWYRGRNIRLFAQCGQYCSQALYILYIEYYSICMTRVGRDSCIFSNVLKFKKYYLITE
jgi:hypothetical protein